MNNICYGTLYISVNYNFLEIKYPLETLFVRRPNKNLVRHYLLLFYQ